jgi:hypothetical protein
VEETRYKQIIERITELNPEALFAEGFDQAIIGYTNGKNPIVPVYDVEKCIVVLTNSGMPLKDAVEYFEYNVLGSHFGENDPIFISL